MLFVPPMVASNRVPASRLDALPVSIGWPLYQSRAPPEFPALVTEQDDRADTRIERAAPAGTFVTEPSANETVSSFAALKSLPPAATLARWPVPTTLPFTSTSARRSNLSRRLASVCPIHSLAGLRAESGRLTAFTVVSWLALLLLESGSASLAETVAVLLRVPV